MMLGPNEYEEQILCNQVAIMSALGNLVSAFADKNTEKVLDNIILCVDETAKLLKRDCGVRNG